jgi:Flp pilus assembly protein TadG
MGQQQLLLIILGVMIVGVAVAIGITLFKDNAVDQNRNAVIADLTTLAAKAQQYNAKPVNQSGGGNSFVGLTANAQGLALLALTTFTNNSNGVYTIKTAGTATTVVLHGVGKTALSDGTFPTYDMTVTLKTQTATKLN